MSYIPILEDTATKHKVPWPMSSISPPPPSTSRTSARDSASPPPRIFDGSQFAYVSKPLASRFRSISTAASGSSEGVAGPSRISKPAAPKRRTAAATKRTVTAPPTFAISEEQWKPLRSCVLCNEAWTARKGSKGKIDHMKKCSKEYFASEDVVEAKILEQLASIEPAATAPPELPNAKKTLLDDELATRLPPPRRRVRKQVPVESIGPATGNWDHILQRSDAPAPSSDHAGGGHIPPLDEPENQGLDGPAHISGPHDAFPSTQLPAPSRFAPTKPVYSILGDYFGTNIDDNDAPPPTQQLPKSKFASRSAFAPALTPLVSEPDHPSIPPPPLLSQSSAASIVCAYPSSMPAWPHG